MARKPTAMRPPGKDDKLEALTASDYEFVRRWMEAIDTATEEEKEWRETQAANAVEAYRGDKKSGATSFNIFHSNTEVLIPAIYNSTPIPDVRRRFNDDDPTAAAVAELIERALAFSVDDYDFDDSIKPAVKDMMIVDRGLARIRYLPTFNGEDGQEEVSYEEVQCEYVRWRGFRHGPASVWKDVPWVAFEHYLSRPEVSKLVKGSEFAGDMLAQNGIPFCHHAASKGEEFKDMAKEVPMFGARARVWEIWDKDTRTVVFICPDYSFHPLKVIPDPLELREFFPIPRPMMAITTTDDLTPVTPFSIYSELIDELNVITRRITALVEQLRIRGGYAGVEANFKAISEGADGEFVSLANAEMFATTGGGLDKAIFFWPIEPIYKAVEALVAQREVVKQTIYEVTGLSDILRGASDPNETATAQGIKQQWGSIRVQNHQAEIARFCRDIFRLKAEVFCKKFSLDTFFMMTGINYPTGEEQQAGQQLLQEGIRVFEAIGEEPPPEVMQQAQEIQEMLSQPPAEEVERMLRDDNLRRFRVEIETDSTVRGDLTKNQEQMARFLEGFAQFTTAMGPAVQEGLMPPDVAVAIASAFVRTFRLGKKAEDALDKWATAVEGGEMGGKPPDPAMQAEAELKIAQAEKLRAETAVIPEKMQLEKERGQFDMQIAGNSDAREDQRLSMEGSLRERELAANEWNSEQDRGLKTRELDDRSSIERERMMMDGDRMMMEQENADRQHQMERLKLKDGRQARMESYQAAAVPNEQGVAPPVPMQEPLEDDMMTGNESARMEQMASAVQAMADAMAQMAQAQQEATAQMAQAIEGLTQVMMAPKRVVRDQKGEPIGVQPVLQAAE